MSRAAANQLTPKRIKRQEAILKGALELLDISGLEGLTLRKLAKHLDMNAPSLYWYFKDKRALTNYISDTILKKEFGGPVVLKDTEDWQTWLASVMLRLRRAMLRYRDGGQIVTASRYAPANILGCILSGSLDALESRGVTTADARTIILTSMHFTFGRVIEEQELPAPDVVKAYLEGASLVNHPRVVELLQENLDAEEEFRRSLALIIGS